ncbi:MAG: CinA family protein, partial [Chloroflexota bacterium]|nr:CinA family protein [Chloroflexota bacterium]
MPDLTSLATPAATLLKASGQSIAVAESSCGGLISAALVSIPGASDYYVGGSTIYTR